MTSPHFRMNSMTSLEIHHKIDVEESEPDDLDLQDSFKETHIVFNEELVVCTFHSDHPPKFVSRSVHQLAGLSRLAWINPSLKTIDASPTKIPSILKGASRTSISQSYL